MCSDKMRSLVTDLENAVSQCVSDSARQQGAVSIKVLSKAVITRATLLRAISELEEKSDLWFNARMKAIIEDDLAASHHSLTGR